MSVARSCCRIRVATARMTVSPADAGALAERLRAAIEAHETENVRFTVSVGVAMLREDETLEQGIARADDALYCAKRDGRNRVTAAAA